MLTYEITVRGKVQGVFFRDFTQNIATKLGIKGYVKNLPNGNVFVVAQGTKIEEFLKKLRQGPPLARVSELKFNRINADEVFSTFEVRY